VKRGNCCSGALAAPSFHPEYLTVHEVGEAGGDFYIVMELSTGSVYAHYPVLTRCHKVIATYMISTSRKRQSAANCLTEKPAVWLLGIPGC